MLILCRKLMGMRLLFWYLSWKFSRNFLFCHEIIWAASAGDEVRNVKAMFSFNSEYGEIVLTWLPGDEEHWVTASPNSLIKFLPIFDFRPSAPTVKVTQFVVQPLLDTGICTSLQYEFVHSKKSGTADLYYHEPRMHVDCFLPRTTRVTNLERCTQLPESTSRVVEMLSILIGAFKVSFFAISFWMSAIILSSQLL